jgi:L-aspartate oxidase
VAEDVRSTLGRSAVGAIAASATFGEGVAPEASGAPWRPGLRLESRLRTAVGRGLGVTRDAEGIRETLSSLDALAADATTGESRNMILVGRLIAASALIREESRGAHRRRDFPEGDPRYAQRVARTADELLAATTFA